MAVLKSKTELYLQQIFRMLLESKTEEAIAKELGVSTRTVQRYKIILDQRYDIKLLKLSNNRKKHPIEMTNEQYNSWEGNENEKKEKEI